jgi:hypothetical protein
MRVMSIGITLCRDIEARFNGCLKRVSNQTYAPEGELYLFEDGAIELRSRRTYLIIERNARLTQSVASTQLTRMLSQPHPSCGTMRYY